MRDEKRKGSVLGPLKSHSTANISKTVSRSVKRQLGLNISSTEPFEIFIAQGGIITRGTPIKPNVLRF